MTDQKKSIEARDFDSTEIGEINSYITANIPYSVLQTTFPLTENLYHKAQVYTIVFRIISGAKNYVEEEKTKQKLIELLEENRELYTQVYSLIVYHDNSSITFGKHLNIVKLKNIFVDYDKNYKINKLIDIFLIFAEKLTLLDTNKIVGIELDTKEGMDLYKKLNSAVEIKKEDGTTEPTE